MSHSVDLADDIQKLHRPTTIKGWQESWHQGDTEFHIHYVNPSLVKFQHIILPSDGHSVTIYVPCCGKSVDIKWLYERGHSVVGVDCSPLACESFFKENDIEYRCDEFEGGALYQNPDSRIKLFACDIYIADVNLIGQFDAVWDTGAFVAINPWDRKRYIDLILSVLKPSAKILLEIIDFKLEIEEMPGEITEQDILRYFGVRCDVKVAGASKWVTNDGTAEFPMKVFEILPPQ